MRSRWLLCSLYTVLLVGLFTSACGDDDSGPAATQTTDGTVAAKTPNITVVNGGVPDGFPRGIPVFSDAVVVLGRGEDNRYYAEWTSEADEDEVSQFYLQAMDEAPFSTTNVETGEGGGTLIVFENPDGGYTGQVGIAMRGLLGSRILLSLEIEE